MFSVGGYFRKLAQKQGTALESAKEQRDGITQRVDAKTERLLKGTEPVIVEGWLAGIRAQGISDVLKVLLTSSLKTKVARFSEREGVTPMVAKEKILSRAKNWRKEIWKIYKLRNVFNKKYYDLIIDTDKLDEKKVLEKVLRTLKK